MQKSLKVMGDFFRKCIETNKSKDIMYNMSDINIYIINSYLFI